MGRGMRVFKPFRARKRLKLDQTGCSQAAFEESFTLMQALIPDDPDIYEG